MASLNEIVQDIAEEIDAGTDFTIRQKLKDEVIGWRATFFRRDRQLNNLVHDQVTQALGVITMVRVDKGEGGIPATIDKQIWKSELPIPIPVRFKNASLSPFTFVGSPDRHTAFTYIQPEAVNYIHTGRYTKDDTRYTYRDGHLYVYDIAKKVFVRGVFEDPRDVEAFNGCVGSTPYTDDNEFPVPEDMINLIKQQIYGRVTSTRPEDASEIKINED